MKAKKVLFATDFSTISDSALRVATFLARALQATLVVVHVEEPPIAYGAGDMYYGVPDPNTTALRQMLAAIRPHDEEVPVEHLLLAGDPAQEITSAAKRDEAEMIVLASHGRSGIYRFLMGSVAEQVLRQATCPVVTIKTNAQLSANS